MRRAASRGRTVCERVVRVDEKVCGLFSHSHTLSLLSLSLHTVSLCDEHTRECAYKYKCA